MYTVVRCIALRRLLTEQAPIIIVCFLIAEAFYKFHSFTLECGAFLVTWFVLDFLVQSVRAQFLDRRSSDGRITRHALAQTSPDAQSLAGGKRGLDEAGLPQQ